MIVLTIYIKVWVLFNMASAAYFLSRIENITRELAAARLPHIHAPEFESVDR